jgi:hypothetical protein
VTIGLIYTQLRRVGCSGILTSKEKRRRRSLRKNKVSEVRVRLGITLGYARAPKVRDISSKYISPPLRGGPYFLDAFLKPRLVLG